MQQNAKAKWENTESVRGVYEWKEKALEEAASSSLGFKPNKFNR